MYKKQILINDNDSLQTTNNESFRIFAYKLYKYQHPNM